MYHRKDKVWKEHVPKHFSVLEYILIFAGQFPSLCNFYNRLEEIKSRVVYVSNQNAPTSSCYEEAQTSPGEEATWKGPEITGGQRYPASPNCSASSHYLTATTGETLRQEQAAKAFPNNDQRNCERQQNGCYCFETLIFEIICFTRVRHWKLQFRPFEGVSVSIKRVLSVLLALVCDGKQKVPTLLDFHVWGLVLPSAELQS